MTPPPAKRISGWKRRLLWIVSSMAFGLVAVYFVLTSNAFLRTFALPRISHALELNVAAEHIDLQPPSGFSVTGLTIESADGQTMLAVGELQVRYRWRTLLTRTPILDSILLTDPVVHIERTPKTTPSLDPFLQPHTAGTDSDSSAPEEQARSPWLINRLLLRNASIQYVDRHNPSVLTIQLSGLDLDLQRFGPGSTGILELVSRLDLELTDDHTTHAFGSTNHGAIEFELDAHLFPTHIAGRGRHTVDEASGRFASLKALTLQARTRYASNRLERATVQLTRNDEVLGEIHANGRADLATREVQLRIEIPTLPPSTTALLLEPWSLDLGQPEFEALVDLETYRNASLINVAARVGARAITYRNGQETAPALDLDAGVNLTLDASTQLLRIANFNLQGSQGSRRVLHGSLNEPLILAWRKENYVPFPSGTLELGIEQLNLAAWEPLIPINNPSGTMDLTLLLSPEPASGGLSARMTGSLDNFAATPDDNHLLASQAFIDLRAVAAPNFDVRFSGSVELNRISLTDLASDTSGEPLRLRLDLSGTRSRRSLDFTELQLQLPETQLVPDNTLSATGTVNSIDNNLRSLVARCTAGQLDLTPLWLAWPSHQADSTAPSVTGSPPPQTNLPPEPASASPLALQWTNTFVDLHIDELRLKNLVAKECSAHLEVDPTELRLAALNLTLDRGTVTSTAALDGSRPEWRASGTLNTSAVELEPWFDLFLPQYRGQARAQLFADLSLESNQVNDPAWPARLTGRGELVATNAQIELFSPAVRQVLLPIAQVLRVPELTQSPLDWLSLRIAAQAGRLHVDQLSLQSSAFHLTTAGALDLSAPLSEAQLSLPLDLSLHRNLALTTGLITTNDAAGSDYVRLPLFASVSGTLVDPQTEFDKLRLGGLLLRSGVGIAENLGADVHPSTGRILRAAGDILSGQSPSTPGTNQPSTFNTLINLLELLR